MAVTNIIFFSSISYYILSKKKRKKKVFYTLSHTHILTLSFPFFVHLLWLIWKSLFFHRWKGENSRENKKKAQKKTLAQAEHNTAAHNEQMNDQTNKQTHRQTRVYVCIQPTKATQWKTTMFFQRKALVLVRIYDSNGAFCGDRTQFSLLFFFSHMVI